MTTTTRTITPRAATRKRPAARRPRPTTGAPAASFRPMTIFEQAEAIQALKAKPLREAVAQARVWTDGDEVLDAAIAALGPTGAELAREARRHVRDCSAAAARACFPLAEGAARNALGLWGALSILASTSPAVDGPGALAVAEAEGSLAQLVRVAESTITGGEA